MKQSEVNKKCSESLLKFAKMKKDNHTTEKTHEQVGHMYQPKTIGDLPDIARSLQKLKIVIDLRNMANENTLLGLAIIQSCDRNEPADDIIRMVKYQAEDNPGLMYGIIGEELTERILDF